MEEVETPATVGRRTYVAAWFRYRRRRAGSEGKKSGMLQAEEIVTGQCPRVQSWHPKKLFGSEKHYPEEHVVGLE